MKLSYYPETDSLYIELCDVMGAEVREIAPGFNADIDQLGQIVGIDIDHASSFIDLTTIEITGIPRHVITNNM